MSRFLMLGITIFMLQPLTALAGPTACVDADGDGYFTYSRRSCPAGNDCNDADAGIYPGALEECGDGLDNNCNGVADEGCPPPPAKSTRRLYELNTLPYPNDLELLPSGELMATSHLLLFPSTAPGTNYVNLGPGVNYSGLGNSKDNLKFLAVYDNKITIWPKNSTASTTPLTVTPTGVPAAVPYAPTLLSDVDQDRVSGNYYLTDNRNHRVVVVNSKGKFVKIVDDSLASPTRMMISDQPEHYRWVISSNNYFGQVEKFSSSDTLLDNYGGGLCSCADWSSGTPTYYLDDPSNFCRINGLAEDGSGKIYILEDVCGTIKVFDKDGNYQYLLANEAGTGNFDAAEAIIGLAVSQDGRRLYVSEFDGVPSSRVGVYEILP